MPSVPKTGSGYQPALEGGALKGLLTRWREKVFVLLVRQKLQEMADERARGEMREKVNGRHHRE